MSGGKFMSTKPLSYDEYLEVVDKTTLIGNEVCFLDTANDYISLKKSLTPDYFEDITKKYIEDCFNLDKRKIHVKDRFSDVFEDEYLYEDYEYSEETYNHDQEEQERSKRMELFKRYGISYRID